MEKNYPKTEEKKKAIGSKELREIDIEEATKRIGRFSTNSLTNKALEAMKGLSKSLFTLWIIQKFKSKEFSPPTLETFDKNADPVAHKLQFKERISLEEVTEGLICKLFSMNFTRRALSWFSQIPKGSV